MFTEAPTNPVIARLTQQENWPSLRTSVWLALALWLATLTITTLAVLLGAPKQIGLPFWRLSQMAQIIARLSPLIVAAVALTGTARDRRSEAYQEQLTTLSKATIVRGYIFTALYRLRVLLILVVGLMPAVVVGSLYQDISRATRHCCVILSFEEWEPEEEMPLLLDDRLRLRRKEPCIEPSDTRLIWRSLMHVPVEVGWWGMNLLGAAMGVGLGLRWRRTVLTTISAPLVTLLTVAVVFGMLIFLSVSIYLGYAATTCLGMTCTVWFIWPVPYAEYVAFLVLPYALGAGAMHLIRWWV